MMTFDHDAFISYAHRDNAPFPGHGQKGWVTVFGDALQERLNTRLGRDARVWIDATLKGNEVFTPEIADRLAASALLVSILSPSYVGSGWCQREIDEFCAAAARTGGLTLGNMSRVVKVIKLPAEPVPAPMQGTVGYRFYADDNKFPIELQPDAGGLNGQQYLHTITRLAYEITQALGELNPALAAGAVAATPRGQALPAVFMADCGRDQQDARARLTVQLNRLGHEVLQLQPAPESEDALPAALNPLLDRCALSVHLVGNSVGRVPDGPSGHSLVMLENSLAALHCQRSGLRRIIWLPAGAQGERPEQQAFIDRLETSAAEQAGADLLRSDFETLKEAIDNRLRQLAAPPTHASTKPSGPPRVHLMMSEADRPAVVPLIQRLEAQGIEWTIPVFAGKSAEVRRANTDHLLASDATILVYGAGNELWKLGQVELRKRTITPDRARPHRSWTCLMPPLTDDKALLQQVAGPGLIDALGGLSGAALLPVVEALKSPGRGP